MNLNLLDRLHRRMAITVLAWACCTIAIKADDVTKLSDLGTYFANSKGELLILLTGDHAVWQNGRPLISRPYPDCGMMLDAFLKPGGSVVVGGSDAFIRYRLDRLTPEEAAFTIWHYTSVAVEPHHYRPGKVLSIESARVDLPLTINDDSQPNLVQLGRKPAVRTK